MRVDGAARVRVERLVQQGRKQLASLVTGHGRNRSSFSLRSIRARCRREGTAAEPMLVGDHQLLGGPRVAPPEPVHQMGLIATAPFHPVRPYRPLLVPPKP